jgi:hypothetical protein
LNGYHIDLPAIVILFLGGLAAYLAYRDTKLGAAIGVGVVVVTVLWLVLGM